MADWNPDLYRQFEAERTRPAKDLLAMVSLDRAADVVDLGCGPGNSTELLAQRYPEARLMGLDSSEAMLISARERLPGVAFAKADIATWTADRELDLLYANAVLQWLPDHATLLPRLFGMLAPGGVLAVQMPNNLDEPSHRLMREVAASGPWAGRIGKAGDARREAMLSVTAYYDLLAPRAAETEVWRTAYQHPMRSVDAIVDWVRATGLRPFLDPLTEPEQSAFIAGYKSGLAEAYPERRDGKRLLAFPRLFIVARRKA